MPITPREFLGVAEELQQAHQHARSEPHLRTAVGRSYYAAYLGIRELLRKRAGDLRYDIRHQDLCAGLKASSDPGWREVGHNLDLLRRQREEADYSPHAAAAIDWVPVYVGMARQILDAIPSMQATCPDNIRRRA